MRKLLFFSVAEAAEDISNTQPRQWQRYESATRPIPDDVIDKMHWYLEVYQDMLDRFIELVERQIDELGKAYIPAIPSFDNRGDLSEIAIVNIHEAVISRIQADYLADVEFIYD